MIKMKHLHHQRYLRMKSVFWRSFFFLNVLLRLMYRDLWEGE